MGGKGGKRRRRVGLRKEDGELRVVSFDFFFSKRRLTSSADRDRRLRPTQTNSHSNSYSDQQPRTNNFDSREQRNDRSNKKSNQPAWMDDDANAGSASATPSWMDAPATGGVPSFAGKERETSGADGGAAPVDSIQAWKQQMKEIEKKERERNVPASVEPSKQETSAQHVESSSAPSVSSPPVANGPYTDFGIFTAASTERPSVFENSLPQTSAQEGGGESRARSRFAKKFFNSGEAPPQPPAQKAEPVRANEASREDLESMNRLMGMLQGSGVGSLSTRTSLLSDLLVRRLERRMNPLRLESTTRPPLFPLRPLFPSKRRDLDKARRAAVASRSRRVLNHRRRDKIISSFHNSSNNSSPRKPPPPSKRSCNHSSTRHRILTDQDSLILDRRRKTMRLKGLRLSRISINSARTDTLRSKVRLVRNCPRYRPESLVYRNTPILLFFPLSTPSNSSTTSSKDWSRWVPTAVVHRLNSLRCTLSILETSAKLLRRSEWVLDRPSSLRRNSNSRSPVDPSPPRTASLHRWDTLRNTSLSSNNSRNECRRRVLEGIRIRLGSLSRVEEECLDPRWI